MEEPTRTNRNAASWAATPLTTDAATWSFYKSKLVPSTYEAALSRVYSILEDTTDRFSTNWSYTFRSGGGVQIDTLEVRSLLSVALPTYSPRVLEARYLSVTNGGRYGSVFASNAVVRGRRSGVGEVFSSSASIVTSSVFSTSFLGSSTTFDSPAVIFTRPPLLTRVGDVGGSGGWESCSVVELIGSFPFGKYYDGLLKLDMIRTSTGVAHALLGEGMGAAVPLYHSPEGGPVEKTSVTNVPILVTHFPLMNPLFLAGFWKNSPEKVEAAKTNLVASVDGCFSVMEGSRALSYINGGTNVASYTTRDALNIDSPSIGARARVVEWGEALVSNTKGLVLNTNSDAAATITNGVGVVFVNSWDTIVVTNDLNEVETNRTGTATITRSDALPPLRDSMSEGLLDHTNLAAAISKYSKATEVALDPTTGLLGETAERGVLAVADNRKGGVINYSKYRQMLPEKGGYYRVTMQLSFNDPEELPSPTPARYWLVSKGKRLLTHTVSAAGETGPAFAFLDMTTSDPGYLYLDMSEFVKIHGIKVLKAASYYVKLEALRGLDKWHNQ